MTKESIENLIAADMQVRTPFSGLPLLLQKLSDDEIGFDDLVETLQRFPSVTARLLAVANSAWCAPRVPVTSLQSTCTQLGLALVRSISISVAVSAPFDTTRCPRFDTARFWYSALLAADGAERLAAQCNGMAGIEPKAVHTAGLLHNIGLLWLADKLPAPVARACEMADRPAPTSVNEALRRELGTDIAEVSGLLLEAWRLPAMLATTIRYHRDSDCGQEGWQSAALLGGAARMVGALRRDQDCPALPSLDRLGISLQARQKTFAKMRQKSGQIRAAADALARL